MSLPGFTIFYLARWLEGGLFGIYSGVFAIYLACQAKRQADGSNPPIVFYYALWVLYVLTAALFVIDIVPIVDDNILGYHDGLDVAQSTIFGFCDFIAQCILIHRCWILYGQNIRVIIVPSILALAYLVMWLAADGALFTVQNVVHETVWGAGLILTSFITSMTVNALVTGLIVFRILKVMKEVKGAATLEDKSFGITHENANIRSVPLIIIESGMALFVVQLARVAVTISLTTTEGSSSQPLGAVLIIAAIHEMVNGIAPTIILVRVSLGLSFHDKESFVEAVGSLQFAANPIPDAGSVDQDRSSHIGNDDDFIH